MYIPTDDDYALLKQTSLIYYVKVEVHNNGSTINENTPILDNLEGIVIGGNCSINADSDVRRTASVTIVPIENKITITNVLGNSTTFDLTERSKIWLDKNAVLYCGIENMRTNAVVWYKLGTYSFQSQSITYDATTNQMAITAADLMTWLDGTINGQLGSLTTIIPAYTEDPDTGAVLTRSVIRDAMVSTVSELGNVSRYIIDEIGEFKGLKQYNEAGWAQYRNNHPLWNNVPYDLEFSTGCNVTEIVDTLRDLYPNNETFFDSDGVFRCQAIPSCYYDDIVMPDYMLQQFLISENTNRDFTSVRNVSEVWGQILENDYYSEDVESTNGVYTAIIAGMDEEYKNKDRLALKIPKTNVKGQAININDFGNVVIYSASTEEPIEAGVLETGEVYVFLMDKESDGTTTTQKFYLQGKWQTHAICVLTDGTISTRKWTDPNTKLQYPVYSQEYFKLKYNCSNVELMVNPESPYTVQKIGERLAVYSGSEYDSLFSDDLARDRAHFETWKTARLTDNITLTTILIPFLEVNTKVSYRMQNSDEIKQYIIKSISHDFSGLTTTITMMTFYPLYESHTSSSMHDAYLTVKGTQNFYSAQYVNGTYKNTSDLAVNDIVWVLYHGNYRTAKVAGFGGDDKIGNKDVKNVPWVDIYPLGAENINNYLFGTKYRTATAMVTNRFQTAGQFKYRIYASDKTTVVAQGVNDAAGNIIFTGIDTSTLDVGNYVYYAKQVAGSTSGITYDSSERTINVKISSTGNSTYYEATYDVVFTNTY